MVAHPVAVDVTLERICHGRAHVDGVVDEVAIRIGQRRQCGQGLHQQQ